MNQEPQIQSKENQVTETLPIRKPIESTSHVESRIKEIEQTIVRLESIIDTGEPIEETNLRLRKLHALERQAKIGYKELSGIDFLTGELNRRGGEPIAENAIAMAARGEITLVYIRMDIDHFKLINDTQGHPWGDEILKQVASVLNQSKRETDTLFRYGGEEFDLILPMSPNLNGAEIISGLEHFRKAIHSIKRDKDGQGEDLSGSFGALILLPNPKNVSEPPLTLEQIQSKVDLALYRAKEAGRDRIAFSYSDNEIISVPTKEGEQIL